MRPRKHNRHLPPCVFHRHGAFYLVKRGKWTRLSDNLQDALTEYARLHAQQLGGMAQLIEEALPSINAGKALATRKLYTLSARKAQEIFKNFTPYQVTPAAIAQMRRGLADTPAMANRIQSTIKLVFDYALELGIVDSNPVVGAKRLPQKARTRRITAQEFQAVIDAGSERLRVVMNLCHATGQRIGDVLAIRREHLRDDGIYFRQAKTGAEVLIEWNPALVAAVEAAKAAHGPVASMWLIKGAGSHKQAYQPIYKDWRAACKKAGVEGAVIHDLRAMSASDARQQGLNAQTLLGHTSGKMTERYLRDRELKVAQGPSIGQKRKVLDGR
jgi:integrase